MKNLEPSNVGRNWLLNIFADELVPLLPVDEKLKTGVIGGSKKEPEITFLEEREVRLDIQTLGIESSDIYVDLNSNQIPLIDYQSFARRYG